MTARPQPRPWTTGYPPAPDYASLPGETPVLTTKRALEELFREWSLTIAVEAATTAIEMRAKNASRELVDVAEIGRRMGAQKQYRGEVKTRPVSGEKVRSMLRTWKIQPVYRPDDKEGKRAFYNWSDIAPWVKL